MAETVTIETKTTLSKTSTSFSMFTEYSGDRDYLTLEFTVAAAQSITIPHSSDLLYTHDYIVDYGDDSGSLAVTSYDDVNATHAYDDAGTYIVKIYGVCNTLVFDSTGSKLELTKVTSWGNCSLQSVNFYGCSNLVSLPDEEGKLTEIVSFESFCRDCASLTSIPTGIFDNCTLVTTFNFAFSNCILVTSIPENLFSYCTLVTDFTSIFYNCTSLTSIPTGIFDNNALVTTFASIFNDCSSLISISTGIFDNCILVTTFNFAFRDCTSLISIPIGIFDNNTLVTTFEQTFYNCTSLTSIPTGIFDNCTLVTTFKSTFLSCTSLISIPIGIFDNNTLVTTFEQTFLSCTSLTSISTGIFDNNILVTIFTATFNNCTSLTSDVPELWLISSLPNGDYCFYNCLGANNYDDIPDDWKGL